MFYRVWLLRISDNESRRGETGNDKTGERIGLRSAITRQVNASVQGLLKQRTWVKSREFSPRDQVSNSVSRFDLYLNQKTQEEKLLNKCSQQVSCWEPYCSCAKPLVIRVIRVKNDSARVQTWVEHSQGTPYGLIIRGFEYEATANHDINEQSSL